MAEEIKGLIEKIREEGFKAAQEKASGIEQEARRKAQEIINKARAEADGIVEKAKDESSRIEESTKDSLRQASRDMLLSLKKEIGLMLQRIVEQQIKDALKPEELSKLISSLVKTDKDAGSQEIAVLLNSADLERMEKSFVSKLAQECQKKVVLKPSQDISGGFIISYDSGKSQYDFTDKALASYISSYLRPRLARYFETQD